MCGVLWKQSFNGQPVNGAIKQLYKNQRMRGTDGFGFYIPELDRLAHNRREHRILDLLGRPEYQATSLLFHHRWPTSTNNVQNSCHPFSTKANKKHFKSHYVMIHNGIITNARELQAEHEAMGIKYISKQADGQVNDSEALLYDLALYLDGKQEAVKAEGSIAFILLRDRNRLMFGRNIGSPLVYDLNSRALSVKSEGGGQNVQVNKLYEFHPDNKTFTITDLAWPAGYYTYPEWHATTHTTKYDLDEPMGFQPKEWPTKSEIDDLVKDLGSVDDAIDFATDMASELQEKLDDLGEKMYREKDGVTKYTTEYEDLEDEIEGWWAIVQRLWRLHYGNEQSEAINAV